jgi:phosphogluconate dehydratase
MIRLDAEAGTLEVRLDARELAERPQPVPDLSGNAHGFGRELFTAFRALSSRADEGASVFQ